MNAHETECRFWQEMPERFRHPQGDFLREGFAPPGGLVADYSVVKRDGEYHAFYIERRMGGDCSFPGHEIYLGHSSTPDFQHWTCHEPVMLVRPGTWEESHVFAPFVLEAGGRYAMLYAGQNRWHSQAIGVAFSDDLFEWRRHPGNPVILPGDYGWACWSDRAVCSCRDPHVNREGDDFLLYYTACTREGHSCVALAVSRDLVAWKDQGPVYVVPGPHHLESSCVHRIGGGHVLFCSADGGTRMRLSNRHDDFGQEPGEMVWEGMLGLEVVERRDPAWLVSAFSYPGNRLFLAVLDWSAARPRVGPVLDPVQLAPFLGTG